MHPKVRRCVTGLTAVAALAIAPAAAQADFFDPHDAYVTGTQLITPSNPSFYSGNTDQFFGENEVDIDHVTGKATLSEVDDDRDNVILWGYSNNGGSVKRQQVSGPIEVDPDGTFEADDVDLPAGS